MYLTWALVNAGCPDIDHRNLPWLSEKAVIPVVGPDPCIAYCGQVSLHGPPIVPCSCTVGLALSWLKDSKT